MMNDLNKHEPWRLTLEPLLYRYPVDVTIDGRRETIYLPDPEEASRYGRRLQARAMWHGLGVARRWLADRLTGASGAVSAWYHERRNYAELDRLNDHMLRDIGLDRGQLPAVAHALAHGSKLRAGKAEVHAFPGGATPRDEGRHDPRIAA